MATDSDDYLLNREAIKTHIGEKQVSTKEENMKHNSVHSDLSVHDDSQAKSIPLMRK